jgi:ERCC4-type nuclease
LEFKHDYVEGVEVTTLSTGDYGAVLKDGHTIPIFFERKSIVDAVGAFSKGYKRFLKEIKRSKDNNTELIIIIEGTVTDLLKGTKFSQVKGIQILRTLLSIWQRYQVVSVFCKDREEMALFIVEFYMAYSRKRNKLAKSG